MKKKIVQLGIITAVLIICILGYFIISNHYEKKEKKDSENKIVAFSLENYKNTKSISYKNEDGNIQLDKSDGEWEIKGDRNIKVDKDVVETEMLSKLVEVVANDKIDDVSNEEDYGFIKSKDGIAASTNTINIKDANAHEYTLYIGNSNPYDTSKYYMMVKGDDNVYLIESDVAEAFTKTKTDLEKEEETTTVKNE